MRGVAPQLFVKDFDEQEDFGLESCLRWPRNEIPARSTERDDSIPDMVKPEMYLLRRPQT